MYTYANFENNMMVFPKSLPMQRLSVFEDTMLFQKYLFER